MLEEDLSAAEGVDLVGRMMNQLRQLRGKQAPQVLKLQHFVINQGDFHAETSFRSTIFYL